MRTHNIAQQLIHGSQEIDRMKVEIENLVQMLLGLARWPEAFMKETRHPRLDFESDQCKWEVRVQDKRPWIECWIKHPPGSLTLSRMAYQSPGRDKKHLYFSLEYVKDVHTGLDVFARGMLGEFSHLQKRIEPFILASHYR